MPLSANGLLLRSLSEVLRFRLRVTFHIIPLFYTHVLSDSGNPPVIHFCALCTGFFLKVSFSSRLTLLTVINLVYPPTQMLHYHC